MTLRSLAITMSATLIAVAVATPAAAQNSKAVQGGALFLTYCASCHGEKANGQGQVAAAMKNKPADLTQIAKKNGGTFPGDRVYRSIDGRNPAAGHGGQSMPVWGDALKRAEGGGTSPDAVKSKIEALVAYLESVQAK